MDDLISRQAAIRWVKTECNPYGKPTLDYESGKRVMKHLEQMPSAQPEIIRCRECKFFSHGYCRFHDAKFVRPDGYCYWGEQKEGEQHD